MAESRRRPEVLFKYLGPGGLKAVLETRRVRFGDPRLFNDPFDVQLDYRVGFSWAEFEVYFSKEIVRVAYSPEEPDLDESRAMFPFIEKFREMAGTNPGKERELEWAARMAVRESKGSFDRSLQRANDDWRAWLAGIRLFCASEEPDNLLMWAHYCEKHEGGVIALRSVPALDTFLLAAEPVVYRDDLPVLFTLENWLQRATAKRADSAFRDYVLVKSCCWSYEKEWRALADARPPDSPYRYSDLLPQEVAAVYLGCRMPFTIQEDVARLVHQNFPEARVFRARRSATKFSLDFEAIT